MQHLMLVFCMLWRFSLILWSKIRNAQKKFNNILWITWFSWLFPTSRLRSSKSNQYKQLVIWYIKKGPFFPFAILWFRISNFWDFNMIYFFIKCTQWTCTCIERNMILCNPFALFYEKRIIWTIKLKLVKNSNRLLHNIRYIIE
jgi:hypothetical protein